MKNLEAIDEIVERFEHSAEFERTHGNLMGSQEFKQLAGCLKELKAYKEQEPCEDAISRDAALEAILIRLPDFCGDEGGNLVNRNEAALAIRNLHSVTPKQKIGKWIPVESEVFPDVDEDGMSEYILLSFENFDGLLVGHYTEDEDGGMFHIGDCVPSAHESGLIVNAWMPLPEKYDPEEE